MYTLRDITSSVSGDVVVGPHGDLDLANSFETVKLAVNFITRTDKGGYAPDSRVGGNLGSHIGATLSKEVTLSMENGLKENLSKFILSPSDFQVHAVPVTHDTVGIFVAVAGQYLDQDGNILDVGPEVLSFTFPYYEGDPTPSPE
jgi:hypothetical protein